MSAFSTYGRASVFAMLAVAVAVVGPPASAAPAQPDAIKYEELQSVAAVSADDVWAVGWQSSGTVSTAVARHWDGERWRVVPTPAASSWDHLYSVAAVSSDDVWAVGTTAPYTGIETNLVMHWDGTSWDLMDVPHPTGHNDYLMSVTAISSDDVYASGYYCRSGEDHVCFNQTLHWDGHLWTWLDSPPASTTQLVAAVSPSEAWSAGNLADPYDEGDLVAEHWDGAHWQEAKLPKAPHGVVPNDITEGAAGDVWISGEYTGPDGTFESGIYLLHRSGDEWGRAKVAKHPLDYVTNVSADAADDAWVLGYDRPGTIYKPVTEHWDGSRWTYVRNPARKLQVHSHLEDVIALSPTNAWAVGWYAGSDEHSYDVIMHWDGSHWQITD